MLNLDFVADTNAVDLHRLTRLYPPPQFVKQASADTLRPEALPMTAYADPDNRQFPCHNAAATWLSTLYFSEKRAAYQPEQDKAVNDRLERFARYWGIKHATDALRTAFATQQAQDNEKLADDAFALVWSADDGAKHRHCRMTNTAEVKAAAAWLHTYRDSMPFGDRHTVAKKILEKAAQFGANLGEFDTFIEQQAGHGLCEKAAVVRMLNERGSITTDPQQRAGLVKLAQTIAGTPDSALTPDITVKLAELVDTSDRATGLAGRYTGLIPRPETVLFALPLKQVTAEADNPRRVQLTTGSVFDARDFHKIALADLRALLGSDITELVGTDAAVDTAKLAEVAETLPRPDAEIFETLLAAAQIAPLQAKSAADRLGDYAREYRRQ